LNSGIARGFLILFLFPLLWQVCSMSVVLPVMLFNLITGQASLVAATPATAMLQWLVGMGGAIWISTRIWANKPDVVSAGTPTSTA
jgi:hypothetical protein